jgi:hypothetical protein
MVLFTKEYLPISVFCFLLLIFLSWSTLLTYSLPSPFSRVRFEESTYASYLSALCQGFPVRIISMTCKFCILPV